MKKYISTIALALALALSITACSSDNDKKSESKKKSETETTKKKTSSSKSNSEKGNVLAKSASKTQEQDSVQMKGTLTFSGETSGIPINGDFLIEGVQSFKTGESAMKLDMTALLSTLGGGGVATDSTFIIETRTKDGYTYTKTPSIFGSVAKWTKTKATTATSSQDPTKFLEYFKGATDDIETVGKEDIDGISTTQYKATLSAEKYREQIEATSEDFTEDQLDAISNILSEPVDAYVWVDDEGLIRKFEMTLSIDGNALLGAAGADSGSSDSDKLTMKAVIFYTNYGIAVNVELPADEELSV